MRKLLCLILFAISLSCFGQNTSLGSWNILNLKYNVNDRWSVFGEAQIRSLKFYDNFHYYEYKGGINFKAFENLKFSLGLGSYQTYKEDGNFVKPKANDELRIWPQVMVSSKINGVKIEQRYRTELRFTSNGFRNRFRYRFGLSYPFGKIKNHYKPFQISASNELFFTNREPYFERNRFLIAFNYKPSKNSTLQAGYLYQFDYKINDETGRQFLQIGYFIEFFRSKTANGDIDIDLKDN